MRLFLTLAVLFQLLCTVWADDDPLAAPSMKKHAPAAVKLGWRYFKQGDLGTALKRFKMAVRHDKNFAPAHYGVAYVYSAQGKLKEAINSYQETLKLDKKHLYANANLGYALLQNNEEKEALEFLDQALALNPDCGEAHLSYANYYAKHRMWKDAEKSANRASTLGQQLHPEFRKLLESNGVRLKEIPNTQS